MFNHLTHAHSPIPWDLWVFNPKARTRHHCQQDAQDLNMRDLAVPRRFYNQRA